MLNIRINNFGLNVVTTMEFLSLYGSISHHNYALKGRRTPKCYPYIQTAIHLRTNPY